jgi:hypothetical protein
MARSPYLYFIQWAIYAWRNSLVFHDLDKMTSVIIHLFPALVLFSQRWLNCNSNLCFYSKDAISFSFLESILLPMCFYMIWQILYCYTVYDRNSAKVFYGSHATSFTWLFSSFEKDKESKLARVIKMVEKENHVYLFITAQFLYALVTTLPAFLYLQNFYIHSLFIVFLVTLSVYNGADYYQKYLNIEKPSIN